MSLSFLVRAAYLQHVLLELVDLGLEPQTGLVENLVLFFLRLGVSDELEVFCFSLEVLAG